MLNDLFKKECPGIYFSQRGVSIVHQGMGKIKHSLSVPYPVFDETEKKGISEDIFEVFKNRPTELVAFLTKAFRDARVEGGDVVVSLPPKDLIIRFFEMPNIPKKEIVAGIKFEMKKYIPFRIEDVSYDFQFRIKKKANIIEVILCGIRMASLNRYVELFKHLNLNVVAYEPGLFSLFRLLVIKRVISNDKSCVVLDYSNDEANILIAQDGFPYFTRDLKIFPAIDKTSGLPGENDSVLYRLINEVRVSMDYYRRQFLKRDIDDLIIVAASEQPGWEQEFGKELGLNVVPVYLSNIMGLQEDQNMFLSDYSKAFGAAQRMVRGSLVTINLKRTEQSKVSLAVTGITEEGILDIVTTFVEESKTSLIKGLIGGVIAFLIVFGIGFAKVFPLEKELSAVSVETTPLVPDVDMTNLDSIKASERSLFDKKKKFETLIEDYPFFHKKLVLLSEMMPEGVWLESFRYSLGPTSLFLTCSAYAEDEKDRSASIYKFVNNLKDNKEFTSDLPNIELVSYRENTYRAEGTDTDIYYMNFEVKCRAKEKKK